MLRFAFFVVFVILFSFYIVLPGIKIKGPFSGALSIPVGAIPISAGANCPHCPRLKKPWKLLPLLCTVELRFYELIGTRGVCKIKTFR